MFSSKTHAHRRFCLNHSDDIIGVRGHCDYCFKTERSRDWMGELKQCKTCKKNICQNCRDNDMHNDCEEEQRKREIYENEPFDFYNPLDGHYYFNCEKAYDAWCNGEGCYDVLQSYNYGDNVKWMSDKDIDFYSRYDLYELEYDEEYNYKLKNTDYFFVGAEYNEHLMDYDFVKFGDTYRKNENLAKKASRKRMKNKKKYRAYRKRQNDKKGKAKNNKRSRRQRAISYTIKSNMLNL